MAAATQIPHVILAGVEPWGHARPLCAFAARLVLSHEIHVTLFTTPRVCERVKTEISRAFQAENADRLKLIRVIALDNHVEGTKSFAEAMRAQHELYLTAFASAYDQLIAEKPVTCASTKVEFPTLPAPKIVVFDFIVGQVAHIVHKASNNRVKVLGFCSGMASFGFLSFAPAERGGRANFKHRVLQEAEKTGKSVFEVSDDLFHTFTDEVVQMPGFPKMYHWEIDPQDTAHLTRGFLGALWLSLYDTYDACDGLIITSPEAYEPVAIAATKDWFDATGRLVFAIGPIMSVSAASEQAIAGEEAQSEKSAEIKKFMDDVLTSRGKHTMLYISFGSAFWPKQSDNLEAFVDVLIEKKIPFIFSHGSPVAQLSDEFKQRVEQSGLGLLSSWSPQQTILIHPALGWFVTHAGHNSTLEAVSSGVPMICWPFHADQPVNAINLTDNHEVAYELIEVRTGNGLKPRLRTGKAPIGTLDALKAEARAVLDNAFGEDGARKRANVKELQVKIESAWEKGGSADVDMGRIFDLL